MDWMPTEGPASPLAKVPAQGPPPEPVGRNVQRLLLPLALSLAAAPGGSADALARRAVDRLSAMVAYWGADQRCRFANQAYRRWFGIAPEALVGMHLRDLLGPLYALNKPHIDAVLRGDPQEFEREIPDPAGDVPRQALVTYVPDVVDGVVRGFFVLGTDISRIKQAEATLRESEERFRLTLEEAPIGMAIVATDGRFVRVNRALCELLGYAAAELEGLTFQSITHPDDLDADLALAGQLARGEIPRYTLEKRYLRKDGSVVHIKLSGSVLRDARGAPLHFIAQVEDITDRKRLDQEQALLAELGPALESTLDEEEMLQHVLQLATHTVARSCAVHVAGDDGRIAELRASGPDTPEATRDAAEVALRTRQPVLRPAAGEAGATTVLAVPLVLRSQPLGALVLCAPEATRPYDARDVRLAEQVAGRLAMALENARLYAASRRASSVRDEVLAIVAHDLRNPLGTIASQAALLRRRAQPRAGTEATAGEVIQRAATRMTHLISDLLDVTRMEAGALSVRQQAVATVDLLHECLASQEQLARAAGIELRLEVPGQPPAVWGEPERLCQVFENLVGNALKFAGRGGHVTLGVTAGTHDVLFWVRDDGPGMPAEQLPRVFDRFWQASRAARQGSGLGLPIAKGLVEAHGGRIWAESTPGHGSCFFFTIPVAPD